MALHELPDFPEVVPMIMGTGVQFLDFGFSITKQSPPVQDWGFDDPKPEITGPVEDVLGVRAPLRTRRGEEDPTGGIESYTLDIKAVVEMFDRVWVPIPLLRREAQGYFRGPTNWARAYLVKLDKPDADNNDLRLVVAVDTALLDFQENEAYLAPSPLDARNGREFALPSAKDPIGWFAAQGWVKDWCFEVFKEMKERKEHERRKFNFRSRSNSEIYENEMEGSGEHLARYMCYLEMLHDLDILPRLKLVDRVTQPLTDPIDVDLVLDLGNSRSCGLLIESDADHLGVDITKAVKLEMRDLGLAEQTYTDPFPSRFEFARASFGLSHLSERSGRSGAFGWPTVVRVGVEAARLAASRSGSEGASGVSSPKRYLWDLDERRDSWRFNSTSLRDGLSDIATGVAFTTLVNDFGDALHRIPQDIVLSSPTLGFPSMQAFYSRSNLTAFALAEIFIQAISMMNSPKHRMRRAANANLPRRLRRIIMTMPTAMPLAERRILEDRAKAAVELAYVSIGLAWPLTGVERDGEFDPVSRLAYLREVAIRHSVGKQGAGFFLGGPEVLLQWDEATATQAVYLYTQIALNYSGDARAFFDSVRHPVNQQDPQTCDACRLATIDLGGGTTDLVVTSVKVEGTGANVTIFPNQEFREGFNLAGDDALLRVVRNHVIDPIKRALRDGGMGESADYAVNHLVGGDRGDMKASELVRRQQFAAQIAAPIALGMIAEYESFDPLHPKASVRRPFLEFFNSDNQPSTDLVAHVNTELAKKGAKAFKIEDLEFEIDVAEIDRTIRAVFTEMLQAMGEMVHRYRCDLLILSGRASRLPAVRQILQESATLPAHRVISLHQFRVGQWYPFRDHRSMVGDPKTTAAVGAMVCLLGNGQLQNFNFRADQLKPKSTARYFGKLDLSNRLRTADEFYTDLDLDNLDYEVPATPFEFRGPMPLGFRQLAADWWPATRLYSIDYESPDAARRLHPQTPLKVTLRREGRKGSGGETIDNPNLVIFGMEGTKGGLSKNGNLKLRLQTVSQSQGYWLDTGILVES